MLDKQLQNQLQTYLGYLVNPIELVLSIDDSSKSRELELLAAQIEAMSDQVTLSYRQTERSPYMKVTDAQGHTQIGFAGIPMGHEFTSLVLALLHTGGHASKIDAETIEQIRCLPGNYKFETYISLSCQNCPDVVQALNTMATINPNISNDMIDGSLFQQEVDERNIMAVPSVYLNGKLFAQGRISLTEILNKLDSNSASRRANELTRQEPYEVLVIGGGPAGASAAIYAARKGLRTGIVADKFGGQVAETVGIENFISVTATEGPKLVANLEAHVADYDVDVMDSQRALTLKSGDLFEIKLESGAILKSHSIIIATGARWRKMDVPGEQHYTGKGVAYCPHCDGPLFKGKRVAVIGGGNSGIEAAIDLANIVEHVTVLEFDTQLRADEVLQRKMASMDNINVITQAMTTEVKGDGTRGTGLTYTDRRDNGHHQLEVDGIFVQIGLVPNTEWLVDTLDLNSRGEVLIDHRGQTSLPGIFAAGDVTDSPYKQIIIAMGSGASASLGAFDYLIRSDTNVIQAA